MDDCIGTLIIGGIGIYLIILFVVYIVIPFLAVTAGIAITLGVLYGVFNTVKNYIEAISEVFGGRP